MKTTFVPQQQLSDLVEDYIHHKESVLPFCGSFLSQSAILEKMAKRPFDARQRELLVETLLKQYQDLPISELTQKNIESLRSLNTFTVATGHQLCLFTGPLYFIYKLISTIRLTELLKTESPEQNFVPVYWMATEDHDVAEIDHFFLRGQKKQWSTNDSGAVGELSTNGIQQMISDFENSFDPSERLNELIKILSDSYASENLATATRKLVNHLVGKYGIVIIDANDRGFKKSFSHILKRELLEGMGYSEVNKTNGILKNAGYKPVVNPREINLFYLMNHQRERILHEGDIFRVNQTDIIFTREEILADLENNPEKFSPNVLLRPVYQEFVLPNLAYIGGPGELSYWMQIKSLFEELGVSYPILVPRDQAIILNHSIQKKVDKLEISDADIFISKDDFIRNYVRSQSQVSIQNESDSISATLDAIAVKLKVLDQSLEQATMAEKQRVLKGMENLTSKITRSEKQYHEQSIRQIESVFQAVRPDGVLQERRDNFFQYQAETLEDIIEYCHDVFDPLEPSLKVIRL
ncbi:MAG: bacillithiol biosynthesis cysteine-adding enzyme BshC [Flavobacteriales bacterium]|nr:bacillithiol biosynthesis cysteine-adding enzyme BshC [Flavobacteriales bacterium]